MTVRFATGLRQYMANTGSFKAAMANGIVRGYSGPQPASADAAETGTLLYTITKDGGAFTSGVSTNGLNFDNAVAGVISKAAAETWSSLGAVADGTVGYHRHYANTVVTGASTTAVRFDMSVGVGTGDARVSTTKVDLGAPQAFPTYTITFPEAN